MKIEQGVYTILIVEDELPLLNALVDKFQREGFATKEAIDGEEGLMIAKRDKPDLILLDIVMPKMDGITMMKKLRESSDWGKNIPIILLTNSGPEEEKTNLGILPKDEIPFYLVKSNWSLNTVVEKVKERLAKIYNT